jgi:hypothetical protein
VLLVAGGVVLVVVVGFVVLAALAWRSTSSAKATLDQARGQIEQVLDDPRQLLSPAGRAQLSGRIDRLLAEAQTARHQLEGSTALSVLGVLPLLHTQRSGALQLIDDATTTGRTAQELLARVDALTAASTGTSVSLPQLALLTQAVQHATATLQGLDRPAGGLWSGLRSARVRFDQEDGRLVGQLRQGAQVLAYAQAFLGADGPRAYLLAGENNAEMRDQGAVLSVSVLHTDQGHFDVDQSSSVDSLELSSPAPVPVPPGTQAVFGDQEPTQIWQSVNAPADFVFTGTAAQSMYQQATGTHVDGVIGVDVPALASLLALTGPVQVPGFAQPITAATVVPQLLHALYLGVPAGATNLARHDAIAQVATAVVDKMKTEHLDLAQLADTLARDVAGRHLLVWDEVPHYEAVLQQVGASGSVDLTNPGGAFHLAVQSATAAKLDYYVDANLALDVTLTPSGSAVVVARATVINRAPAGQRPSYQLGPDSVNTHVPGEYAANVYLWSPRGSVTAHGVPESGLVVSAATADIQAAQQQTFVFQSVLPHAVRHGHLALTFVPQPRLAPEMVSVTVHGAGGAVSGPATQIARLTKTVTLQWGVKS